MKRLLLLFLAGCSSAPPVESGSVRVDLSSLYKRDGLQMVSKTRQPLAGLRYFLFNENGVSGTGEIVPDPADLSFEVDARVGVHQFAVLGGTDRADGTRFLSYLGYVPQVVLKPLEKTEVHVPFYPAGVARFSLNLVSVNPTGMGGAAELPLTGCNMKVTRTEMLDGAPWEIQTRVQFEGMNDVLPAEDVGVTIFGRNAMGLPTGTYRVSCTVDAVGQTVELIAGDTTIDVKQMEETVFTYTVTPGGASVVPNRGVYFKVATFEGSNTQANLNMIGVNPRLGIAAKYFDGTDATDFTGKVRIRLLDIQGEVPVLDTKTRLAVSVGGTASAASLNTYDVDFPAAAKGQISVPLVATDDALAIAQVVRLDASGAVDEHSTGMWMFHIAKLVRCSGNALTDMNFESGHINNRVIVVLENGGLKVVGGKGVDSHLFVAITEKELSGMTRTCASQGVISNGGTAQPFPVLGVGFGNTPFIDNVVEFINPPAMGIWNPLFHAMVSNYDTGGIPLALLAQGQAFIPNGVRASAELAALSSPVVDVFVGYYGTNGDNPAPAGLAHAVETH